MCEGLYIDEVSVIKSMVSKACKKDKYMIKVTVMAEDGFTIEVVLTDEAMSITLVAVDKRATIDEAFTNKSIATEAAWVCISNWLWCKRARYPGYNLRIQESYWYQ